MADSAPPDHPPPLLPEAQLWQLSRDGFTDVSLPVHLRDLYDEVFKAAAEFFELHEDVKKKAFPAAPNDTEQGYTSIADEKEFLSLQRLATTALDSDEKAQTMQSKMAHLWSETSLFLIRALVDISHFLYIDPQAWIPLLENCMELPASSASMTPTLFRMFRYEPGTGIAGEHRDLGLLTLCVGQGKGLQIKGADVIGDTSTDGQSAGGGKARAEAPSWQDSGDVTLLIGDTLSALSAQRMHPGLHRVVGNPVGRYSAVFALRMDVRPTIDTSLFHPEASEIVKAQDLWDQIRKSRVNVNAQKQVRDEQARRRIGKDVS